MKLFELKKELDELLRVDLAYTWDNVGLLVGELDNEITSVITTLEMCDEVIDDAVREGANLIISHHPLIFSPLKNVVDDEHKQKMIIKMIKNDIALYVAHTNFDIIEFGLNDYIMSLLDIKDVYTLTSDDDINTLGRVGVLPYVMRLEDFALYLQDKLDMKNPRIVSNTSKMVEKVAIVTGSGAEFIHDAMKKADVLVTGDMKYHDAQDAFQRGDCIIDAGHFDTEKYFNYAMKNFLIERLDIDVNVSNSLHNPFKFVEDYYE